MSSGRFLRFLTAILFATFVCTEASAQFKREAFSQQYNDDKTSPSDTVGTMFSFKEYFGGLRHENSLKIGTMFAGSSLVVGGCQIYNNQYWKLPIVYGAIGGGIGTGIYFNSKGRTDIAKYCFIGAGVAYWATLMDGVLSYKPSVYPHAGRATLLSILVPGLGQIYNHEYWKLPIYLGAMGFAIHFCNDCSVNFNRFKNIYLEAINPEIQYTGPISAEQAKYYRNLYRRYRDFSILAIAGVYLLQVIDANVFSYMHNFEVDEDLSLKLAPTVILPEQQIAFNPSGGAAAVGLSLGFTF